MLELININKHSHSIDVEPIDDADGALSPSYGDGTKRDEVERANPFLIRKHPKAPNLSRMTSREAALILKQLQEELAGGNVNIYGEFREYLREACFVNLFFFEKFILGPFGPYDKLDPKVHLDLCNFLQSDACMQEGAHSAIFMPRSTYKTTVATHGWDTWEIIRWPNIRIRVVNAVIDRSIGFVAQIASNFSENDLIAELLEEYYVKNLRTQPGCTTGKFTSPARTKHFDQPSAKAGGVTGSSEGDHHDKLDIDDPAGLDDLDASKHINADMQRKRTWMVSNTKALLVEPDKSRVSVKATRYAPDDLYEDIFRDCREIRGYVPDWANVKQGGQYTIYYREGRENGKPAFPSIWSETALRRAYAKDKWFYYTQIQNNPLKTGLTEFNRLPILKARLFEDDVIGDDNLPVKEWVFVREDQKYDPEDRDTYTLLANCDGVIGVDPAATDKGITAKTCRTAIGMWFYAPDGHRFCPWIRAGFYSIFEMIEHIFEGWETFKGYVRTVAFESNAFQKVLGPIFEREREERESDIDFTSVTSRGDKVVRIRTIVGSELAKKNIVTTDATFVVLSEEKDVFPQSSNKMDVLDMSQLAFTEHQLPYTVEERNVEDEWFMKQLAERSSVTGY